ncbi:VLRF1 family aeRF1-type release factor [Nonomuraea sp. NPDC049649]|uniref:MSMEG_1130 family ribosome hibernation factor n=1 Tax=Nonomuraea sp. NPDC049649 TaxID=3155776 RepID=UPI003448E02F
MATIEELDDKTLLELSGRTDAAGVLSVYVNDDPARDPNATAIDLKNRYRELQRRIAEEGPADRRREITEALDRLAPELDELATPFESGRGRIMFAALGDDWKMRLDSQMPVPNRVVLDDGPFIHPLLELLDEGRPAGVVLVSGDGARLLEWRLGRMREVDTLEQEEQEAPHERAGQIGGGPSGQYHTPMREQRQAREREWGQRFLDQVAETVTNLTGERRWERILISGGDPWTEVLADKLPEQLTDRVVRDSRVLAGLDDAGLLAAVTERLHAEHDESERRLLEQVREAGLTQKGALGLSQVAGALNEGRVAHLVYDPEVRYVGSIDADGLLYAGEETGTQPHTPEPRLNERLVERALATGARVSPIEGASSGILADAEGIGALLRW